MIFKKIMIAFVFLLFAGFPDRIPAYEIKDIKNGGAVKGVVKFIGKVPQAESIAIDKDTSVCGPVHNLDKYRVVNSGMANAVVFIENPGHGKPIPKDSVVALSIHACKVEPLVSIGFVGGKFMFRNNDDILHTLQLKLWLEYQRLASARPLKEGATIYNIAFPKKGVNIEKPIKSYYRYHKDTGFIRVTSNSHPWMRGYVFVFDHPYAAVTDDNGGFMLDNLPQGEYTLNVWHEDLGIEQKTLKVAPGKTLELEVEIGEKQ